MNTANRTYRKQRGVAGNARALATAFLVTLATVFATVFAAVFATVVATAVGTVCGSGFGVMLPAVARADETVIEVSYSHRRVPDLDPPGSLAEGSILTTFSASNPVVLVDPDPEITQLDPTTFTYVFPWDRQTPKTVSFRDDDDQIITVAAEPTPVYPFDVSAHTVPVFHLQTDPANLWDPESGIYVWGANRNCFQTGMEWERHATLSYHETDAAPVFHEAVGMRIHGGSARFRDQKSLRVYFDNYGDDNEITVDFFAGPPHTFRRLLLRLCASPEHTLNTNLVESMYGDLGYLVSRQAFVALYVNEEYWGAYNLRERFDRAFFEHTRDLAEDEYVLIKDGATINGDAGPWWSLMNSFAGNQDYTAHEWYLEMASQIDLSSYIDWLLINTFVATSDNGHANNLVLFKPDGGRWQFIAWDQDSILFQPNLRANHLRFFAAAHVTEYYQLKPERYADQWTSSRQKWHTMFRRFLENSEFKARFYARADSLLAGPLSPAAWSQRIAGFEAVQGPELDRHGERWGWDDASPYWEHADYVRWFVTERQAVMDSLLIDFKPRFRAPVELSSFDVDRRDDGVRLTWNTEAETGNRGFVVYRSSGDPDQLEAIASYTSHPELVGRLDADTPHEYIFTDPTTDAATAYYYQLRHVDTDDAETAHNWIENVWPDIWGDLVFNELMAANTRVIADEDDDFDDWFEMHNAGASAIDLAGLYVSDDPADPTRHRLGDGLSIAPGGYLLLWADDETQQGDRHCAFNLAATGEWLGLYAPDGTTLLDSVRFDRQLPDVSYARQSGDDPPWTYAANPTPGLVNSAPETERVLVLNELLMINETINSDEAGDFDPWLELYNPLPIEVRVGGLTLRDDSAADIAWPLPDTVIDAGGHLLVWLDGQPQQGPLHTDFQLDAVGDVLGLYTAAGGLAIQSLSFGPQAADIAWGRIPDGFGEWTDIARPTPGAANPLSDAPVVLAINEFLAVNDSWNHDAADEYDDWVELFNPGPNPVALEGFYLTDDLDVPDKWALPEISLEPESWLLIWCDGDPQQGPLHTSFRLSADGEEIGLFGPWSMGLPLIDSRVFGEQTADVSEARAFDGGPDWEARTEPTPGASNGSEPPPDDPPDDPPPEPPPPTVVQLHGAYPNPFNAATVLRYDVPEAARVLLSVYDLRGRFVYSLVNEEQPPGRYSVAWSGLDRFWQKTASGVYIVRLVVGDEARCGKVVRVQ